MRRICTAISLRNAAFEKAQGAAAAVIATRMARPAKIWIISDRSLRDAGEELETTVADSTMALRLPLMRLRKAFHAKAMPGLFRKESKSRDFVMFP